MTERKNSWTSRNTWFNDTIMMMTQSFLYFFTHFIIFRGGAHTWLLDLAKIHVYIALGTHQSCICLGLATTKMIMPSRTGFYQIVTSQTDWHRFLFLAAMLHLQLYNLLCFMEMYIDVNASKPHISKMHNVQETQNTVSKQTRNIVFATSIYAILIDFAFEF